MDKLKLAHDWYMKHAGGSKHHLDMEVEMAWKYADEMQAEVDSREKQEAEQKRKEIREMLNHPNTFVEKEGQHFDDVEWQPDWSQAPDWANWWAICSRGQACWYGGEPVRSKNGWGVKYNGYPFHTTSSFNYQGNWQDSLRMRP